MVILDFGESSCYLFYRCECKDGADGPVVWCDYENEYYFTHGYDRLQDNERWSYSHMGE